MKQIHKISNNSFQLLPQKAIFWEEKKTLIISDLHLGKSHHFRKSGVGIPKMGDYKNLQTLKGLIGMFNPQTVLFLGDLFHSEVNLHVNEVILFVKQFPKTKMKLVIGNHDIMDESFYSQLNLEVLKDQLIVDDFVFTHEPLELNAIPENQTNFCGHIHPAVKLKGKARQSVSLPCFYFSSKQAILPSFGKFTGNYTIHPKINDKIYVVVKHSVIVLD